MKSTKDFRGSREAFDTGDTIRKAVKLTPIKKSGKERHTLYGGLDDEDDDPELMSYKKRESALDYFDNGEEENGDDDFDEDEEEWEENEEIDQR